MSMFKNTGSQGLEESQDRLGGGFQTRESDIYLATIKAAYGLKSDKGALGVAFVFAMPDGQEHRDTLYVTNRQGENFYLTENKKKAPLPGFIIVNDICLLTTDKELADQVDEEKVVKLWDFNEKKELPKAVPMLVDLLGQKVALGIVKRHVDVTKKNESTGDYEPTGESKFENVIDKVFHPELHLTVVEARQGLTKLEEAKFWDAWLTKNKGQVIDKRTIKDGQAPAGKGGSSSAGGPPKPGATPATPKASLFGKKS